MDKTALLGMILFIVYLLITSLFNINDTIETILLIFAVGFMLIGTYNTLKNLKK